MNDMPRWLQLPALLNMQRIQEITTLSHQQIYRLISEGSFPKPRQLDCRRVTWHADDLLAWMQEKIDARQNGQFIAVSHLDCFITSKSVSKKTKLSYQSIGRMEQRGTFPRRVQISTDRIVWLEREVIAWMYALDRRQNGHATEH